jgi:hypothetical protein
MAEILCIIPPYVLGRDDEGLTPHVAMEPTGPLSILGELEKEGREVECLDLSGVKHWRELIPEARPEQLLLPIHTVRNIPCGAAVKRECKSKWGTILHTTLGGPGCLELGINELSGLGLEGDLVVQGLGHTPDVLRAIATGQAGNIRVTKPDGNIPVPAVRLLSSRKHAWYRKSSHNRYPIYGFGVGCYWYEKCGAVHCQADLNSPWLSRARELVMQELLIAKALGYTQVWCVDNLLFTDPELTLWFDNAVHNLGMTWSGMTRVELVCGRARHIIGQFKALTEVAMGVEAVSENLLESLERATSRRQMLEAFRLLTKAGIRTTAFVILDIPRSTEQDFWVMDKFLVSLKPWSVSPSFYNPTPKEMIAFGINPANMGFTRWPVGMSPVDPVRVVQQFMLLYGRWWKHPGWTPDLDNPFFRTHKEFGVNFLEGQILQENGDRDPSGTIYNVWYELTA